MAQKRIRMVQRDILNDRLRLLMLAGFAVFVKPDKQVVILDAHGGAS